MAAVGWKKMGSGGKRGEYGDGEEMGMGTGGRVEGGGGKGKGGTWREKGSVCIVLNIISPASQACIVLFNPL